MERLSAVEEKITAGFSTMVTAVQALQVAPAPERSAESAPAETLLPLVADLIRRSLTEHLTPIRNRANELLDDPAELDRLLALGADKAREIASVTLRDVYSKVGFLPYAGAHGVR